MKHPLSQYSNITKLDVYLAKVYAEVLLMCAVEKRTTTYLGLINAAKQMYPQDNQLANAIPVSTGRRLDVIRVYTLENKLPDLTALVVSSVTDKLGSLGPQDPAILKQVRDFDWRGITISFDNIPFETNPRNSQQKRRNTRTAALQQMSDYYKANKANLPLDIAKHRDQIVDLILTGCEPEQAFYSFY